MGKYIVQYALPAIIILPLLWYTAYKYYTKYWGKHVKAQKNVEAATVKYEKGLGLKKGGKHGIH